MFPNDDAPKRALPGVFVLTTFTYEGPITRPRRRQSVQTSGGENLDKLYERLERVDAVTRIVTFHYDANTGRISKKE